MFFLHSSFHSDNSSIDPHSTAMHHPDIACDSSSGKVLEEKEIKDPVSSNITYAFACGNQLQYVHSTLISMVKIQIEVIIVHNVWKVFPRVQPTLIWTMNLISGKKVNPKTLMIHLRLLEWYVSYLFHAHFLNLHFQSHIDDWISVLSA